MTQPTIPERFAARRAELLLLRHNKYHLIDSDFAPFLGFCLRRNIHLPGEPQCGFDLVAHWGESYPTAPITGCPSCGSSFTD